MGSCCITTDKELIKSIFNHPKVYKLSSDDCSPEVYEPDIHPGVVFLTNEEKTGMVRIDQMNGICCQVHAAMLPKAYGRGAEFVRDTIRWGFQNTRYIKIVAIIPDYNRLIVKIVKKCGFTKEGVLRKSFLKNWKLHKQVIYGLTKNEFYKEDLCHQ